MKSLLVVLTFLFPFVSQAHPGHSHDDGGYTIIHYFTSVVHLIPLVVIAVLITLFVKPFRKTIKSNH